MKTMQVQVRCNGVVPPERWAQKWQDAAKTEAMGISNNDLVQISSPKYHLE